MKCKTYKKLSKQIKCLLYKGGLQMDRSHNTSLTVHGEELKKKENKEEKKVQPFLYAMYAKCIITIPK